MKNARLCIVAALLTAILTIVGCGDGAGPDPTPTDDPFNFDSKLSVHSGSIGAAQWGVSFATNAKPTTIKLLGNEFGAATTIKAASPDTAIIGRVWLANNADWEDLSNEIANETPAAAAQRWWDEYGPIIMNDSGTYNGVEDVDYWEGPNEPLVAGAPLGKTEMAWYGAFEAARVELLATNGKRAVIGCFSLGMPALPDGRPPEDGGTGDDPQVWPEFYPAIDAALANDGLLGLHEYGTPMHKAFGDDSDDNYDIRNAGQDMGWLVGRYRRVYYHYLIPDGKVIPLVITESGVDGFGGWQAVPYTSDEYKAQLAWFDSIMAEDDYVLGAQLYAVDMYGWEDFDLAPIMPWLTGWVAGDHADAGVASLPPTVFQGTQLAPHLNYVHDGARVFTSCQAGVYSWEPMKLINRAVYAGDLGVGWLDTNPDTSQVADPEHEPAYFFVELSTPGAVNRIELYPAGNNVAGASSAGFPQAFKIWISTDDTVAWDDYAPLDGDNNPTDVMDYGYLVGADDGYDFDAMDQAIDAFKAAIDWGTTPVATWDYQTLYPEQYYTSMDPVVINIEAQDAKYVLVEVTRRHGHGAGGSEYWVKLSEMAVYGP